MYKDLAAGFNNWLMNDVKYDRNNRDKSNDLVTRYCVECDKPKKVKKGNEERNAICCGKQMWSLNEYLHEKSRMKEESHSIPIDGKKYKFFYKQKKGHNYMIYYREVDTLNFMLRW